MYGNVILKQTLLSENTSQRVALPQLANGLYVYKIILNMDTYTGKINIVQHE